MFRKMSLSGCPRLFQQQHCPTTEGVGNGQHCPFSLPCRKVLCFGVRGYVLGAAASGSSFLDEREWKRDRLPFLLL